QSAASATDSSNGLVRNRVRQLRAPSSSGHVKLLDPDGDSYLPVLPRNWNHDSQALIKIGLQSRCAWLFEESRWILLYFLNTKHVQMIATRHLLHAAREVCDAEFTMCIRPMAS